MREPSSPEPMPESCLLAEGQKFICSSVENSSSPNTYDPCHSELGDQPVPALRWVDMLADTW